MFRIPQFFFGSRIYFHLGRLRFNQNLTKNSWNQLPLLDKTKQEAKSVKENPIILFVVDSKSSKNWRPAEGNLMFEIVQTAIEKYGELNIFIFFCSEGDTEWKSKLLAKILDVNPDQVFLNIEIDPDNSWNWTWDELLFEARKMWDGKLTLFLFDSVYFLHLWRLDFITRRDANCEVISIDVNCKKYYRGTARNIGPVNIPISTKTLSCTQHLLESRKLYKTSFVGAIYPYREKALQKLLKNGLDLKVNPHRISDTFTTYKEYLAGMCAGYFTINFSRANGIAKRQLKCRMIEASLYGVVVISDERKWTSRFFVPGMEYIYVRNLSKASDAINAISGVDIQRIRRNALEKARQLNKSLV